MARTASFSALHLQRLHVRAIDPQLAYDEGARSLDEAEVRKALGCPRAAGGGLCYSYGFIGAPDTPFTEYNRVHLDDPAANGDRKALVPAKRTPPPYFLTSADEGHITWFVTESPEKALSIKSAGISEPIGLGGVDAGFLVKKEEGKPRRLQPLVMRFVKPGHVVYIIMDAGRVNNPRVARAEARLARVLREYGCTVWLVELPLTANGDDQGVDDFLHIHGVQALRDLITRAVPADPVEWAAAARTAVSDAPASLLQHLPFQAAMDLADASQRLAIAAALGTTDDAIASAASDVFARGDQVELAERLLAKLGKPEDIVNAEGRLHVYGSGLWTALDDDDLIRTLCDFAGLPRETKEGIAPLRLSYGAMEGAMKIAAAKTARCEFFAEPPAGVAFENGFLSLTGNGLELVEHSPSHRVRHKYDFPYRSDLDPVLFLGFLASVFRGDQDAALKIEVLRQYVGLCLVGLGARTKRVLILYGDTNSGKSTTLNILRALFPSRSVVVIPPTDFRREDHRAELRGVLVNLVSEMPESEWLDPSAFKSLTGLDAIVARRLYGRPFTFVPIAGHIFGANTLPNINDRTGASHKRLAILAYNRRFALGPNDQGDEPADPHLAEKIVAQEKSAILSWLLRGADQAIKNGLILPHLQRSEDTIAQLRIDTDPIARLFDEEYVLDPDTSLLTSKAYAHFDAWTKENGFGRMSSSTFGKGLTALLRRLTGESDPRSTNSRGQRVYKGIRRKTDEDRRTEAAPKEDRPTPIAHALEPTPTPTRTSRRPDDAKENLPQDELDLKPVLNVLTPEQLQEWEELIH